MDESKFLVDIVEEMTKAILEIEEHIELMGSKLERDNLHFIVSAEFALESFVNIIKQDINE